MASPRKRTSALIASGAAGFAAFVTFGPLGQPAMTVLFGAVSMVAVYYLMLWRLR